MHDSGSRSRCVTRITIHYQTRLCMCHEHHKEVITIIAQLVYSALVSMLNCAWHHYKAESCGLHAWYTVIMLHAHAISSLI